MLILSRKLGEAVIIGDDIVITVLSTKGKQIRLGIEAPASISVHREEIYEKIKKEQQGIVGNNDEEETEESA